MNNFTGQRFPGGRDPNVYPLVVTVSRREADLEVVVGDG